MVDKVDVDKVDQGSWEWIVKSFAPRAVPPEVLLLQPASGTSLFFLSQSSHTDHAERPRHEAVAIAGSTEQVQGGMVVNFKVLLH